MAGKLKHPKLPNGSPVTPKAICYAPDWYTAFYALLSWKNGTLDAEQVKAASIRETDSAYNVVSKIIASYNSSVHSSRDALTFSQVYEQFYDYKCSRDKTRTYSDAAKTSTKAAFSIQNAVFLRQKNYQDLKPANFAHVPQKSHAIFLFSPNGYFPSFVAPMRC